MTAPEAIHLHLTPTRKRLCQDIEDGNVRWYPWVKPWACNKADRDRAVTDKVRLFERCGLAEISRVAPGDSWAPVRLTDAGRVWAGIVHPAVGGEPKAISNDYDLGGDAA